MAAFALDGPMTTAMKSVPTLSAHIFTADGLAKVTISIDFAKSRSSSDNIAGTVVYVLNLVTYSIDKSFIILSEEMNNNWMTSITKHSKNESG